MSARRTIGTIGGLLLMLGAFVPVAFVPGRGDLSFFQIGRGGGGVVMLILGAASLFLALTRRYQWLWLSGGGAFVFILIGLYRFRDRISAKRGDIADRLAEHPVAAAVGERILDQTHLTWGVAVVAVGAVLVLVAAFLKEPERTASAAD